MWERVCMCVYVCMCVHVGMFVCVYVCAYVYMCCHCSSDCDRLCGYVYVYVCAVVCQNDHWWDESTRALFVSFNLINFNLNNRISHVTLV